MLVKKSHLAIAAVVAVAAAFFYFDKRLDDALIADAREKNVASCVREVTRDAYEAAGFTLLADRVGSRGNKGDRQSAVRYRAVASSIAHTFPKAGTSVDPMEMIQVEFSENIQGDGRYRLSEKSAELIVAGCRQAFGAS